jgi:hypothetical protein
MLVCGWSGCAENKRLPALRQRAAAASAHVLLAHLHGGEGAEVVAA